ncbi:MAG: oxygenase MpaB family protein [Pseudomonadota bacterium]
MVAFVVPFLDAAARQLIQPAGEASTDFSQPAGEAALIPADSVSWRIFKNPVALFVGGVTAVILEFAEPAVRSGVWDHSSFRSDPVGRLRRTGLAAMTTVYGARSTAEQMIAAVRLMHARVRGTTPAGEAYRANDPRLLRWVHATAAFGFIEAYSRYVGALSPEERDRCYREGAPAARLYGALDVPRSEEEVQALFVSMRTRLEPSPILFEFLDIMRRTPVFPGALRPLQRLMVRAAVQATPGWIRKQLGLGRSQGLRLGQAAIVRRAGTMADRIILPSSPAVQACRRLGLPEDYLYRGA